MRTNKRYFKCYKMIEGVTTIEYYHTATPLTLLNIFDFIQPLGYHKPTNTHGKEIKEI